VVLGIDTNVLVRLLIEDDAEQTRRAQRLVLRAAERGETVVVPLLVMIETEWVLRSCYGLDKEAVHRSLRSLLETRELEFEDEAAVEEALFNFLEGPCGFADCLIAAHNRRLGCTATATFDTKAVRTPGFVLA
jgi:predicted nucleic-acid-binding protein